MKICTYLLVFSIFLTGITSCSYNESESIDLSRQSDREEILNELSLLIGESLKDKEVRKEILDFVMNFDNYGNSVSFGLLFGQTDKISVNETLILDKDNCRIGCNAFRFSLFNEFINNLEKYSKINSKINCDYNLNSSAELSQLEILILEANVELYFPYRDNFDWDNLDVFSIIYDLNEDLDEDLENKLCGHKFHGNNTYSLNEVNEEYLYLNPVVALIPFNADYLGQFLRITNGQNVYYLDPNSSQDEINGFYNNLYSGGNWGSNFGGGSGGGHNGSGNNSTPVQRIRLTENINPYTFFNDNHVLTTFIPRLRIKGTAWKRNASKAHRTRITRAGSTVSISPTGGHLAIQGAFHFDHDIPATDLRNHRWRNVSIQFDPNWHKAKGSQQIIVWTLRRNSSVKTATIKNEIKIDAQGNFTPNSSISHNFTVSSGSRAIFRGNVELDRDQVLTTVVGGSEYDNSTILHNGLNLSIRRVNDKFEYFFDHFYINL